MAEPIRKESHPVGLASERIVRMRRRFQEDTPYISVQRARYFTEKWRDLGQSETPLPVRISLAMKNVFAKMDHCIHPDDRLAGAWTEFALGWPIDIERGLFNDVLATELDRHTMLAYQAKSYLRFVRYMRKKLGVRNLIVQLRAGAKTGAATVSVGLHTMTGRKINPFRITPADKKELQKKLLPYWRGHSMADIVDRELKISGIIGREMAEFAAGIPNTPSKQVLIVSVAASIATYQGHLVLDQEPVLRKGLAAIKCEVEQKLAEENDENQSARDFLQSVIIALDGVILYSSRLADAVEEKWLTETDAIRKRELAEMLRICRKVPLQPAETFREAMQALWTHRVALEIAHVSNVHSPGRLDQLLIDYYRNDLAAGRIESRQACELLEEYLLKVMTHNMRPESNFLGNFYLRYEGSTPVTIGGLTPEGNDAENELTHLILEAADRSKSVTSIVVRVHKNTSEALYQAVADILHRGTSNVSLMNDDVLVGAMKRYGFSTSDANDYAITGCTDLLVPGKTGGISFSGFLLGHVLDMTLHNGDAQTLLGPLKSIGPRTGVPESFTTFEEFFDAFVTQADFHIRTNVEASNLRDRLFAEHLPAPFLSAFVQGCIDKRTDITRGGAIYNFSGINIINSIANAIDSLFVIKKLVFDEKRFTLPEIVAAIDANFVGHENVHRAMLEVPGKWGNAHAECDRLARRVSTALFVTVARYCTFKGDGPYASFLNSMTSHTIDGRLSIASPDGRKAATPYAASCNPYNVEHGGITGVLQSVAGLDFDHVLGCAVNVRLHPSAIGQTLEARRKWIMLMRTYFKMGGAQIQPTVASAETLREAQREPDKHRDLIVKVGGYSTYFVDLGYEIQNEIIARTEHGATN